MARNKLTKNQWDSGFRVEVNVTPNDAETVEVSKSTQSEGDSIETTLQVRHVLKSTNDEKQEICCVAMVANEVDAHGDMFTPEAVEYAANEFLSSYNVTKELGRQHSGERPDVDLIGSWYTEEAITLDDLEVPANSWVVKMKINQDDTWQDVKDGKITGVSIEGPCWGYATPQDIAKSVDSGDADIDDSTQPKRVFTKADPRNLDLVDEGANLKVLVWKAKDNTMADETTQAAPGSEIVETEALKSAEAPETPAATEATGTPSDPAVEQTAVAKSQEKQPEPDLEDQLVAVLKAKRLTPARAKKLLELQQEINDFVTDAGLSEETDESAGTEVAKSTETAVTSVTDMEALGAVLAKALEPMTTELQKTNARITELEEGRGASAGVDSDEPEGTEVTKSNGGPLGSFGNFVFGNSKR